MKAPPATIPLLLRTGPGGLATRWRISGSRRAAPNRMVIASVRRQAADFEQLKPEGLDLCQYAVQRGLVR